MNIIKGVQRRPRRILLYGTRGIGKSSWAAQSPSPIIVATEDGLDDIGCDRTPLCKSLGDVNGWLSMLATEDHQYRTVAIDTIDWLERLIFDEVSRSKGVPNIEDIGYGKGYTMAVKHWDFFLRSLTQLRDARGMAVILLAHARIVRFQSPESDAYDRYEPDLHKTSSPMIQEWVDEMLFATYRVNTIKTTEGFNKERTRAVGQPGDRIVYSQESPTHLAKRRVPLPDVMPLDFNEYAKRLAAARAPAGDIAGVVVNGHSKQPQDQESKS